ncbi:MAG: hypothetical protein ACREAK_04770 [Nitrosarchaeum sp.]
MFSKENTIFAYTVEKCNLCNLERKRKFKEGDFLFTETSKCDSCNGMIIIEKIFGESIKK